MANKYERAQAAQRLLGDPDLCAVLTEIEEDATKRFLTSGGDPELMATAHADVRAVATLRQALQSRITDQSIALKKERTRD